MTDDRARERGSNPIRAVVGSTVVKVAAMGITGVLGVITTRLIIENFGVAAYAQYGLLASLTAMIPFADLGMSAVVINAMAHSDSPRDDPAVRITLVSCLRVLCMSSMVLALLAVVIGLLGWWPAILGEGLDPSAGLVATLCIVVFAVALPLGIGQRILTGLGRNQLQIGVQILGAPFVLAGVATLIATGLDAANVVPVLPYIGSALVAAVACWLGARAIRPQVGSAFRDIPRRRSVPGVRTWNTAWPMLAQMVALPIAMQTDRLLLSHLAPSEELARYNLGSQLFGLVVQAIGAAGLALWPIFARARSRAEIRSPFRLAVGFALGFGALAGVLAAMLGWIVPIVSDGQLELDGWLIGGFIGLVAGQALKYPLGMYMTDESGLKFQVLPIVAMIPLNLAISWALIGVIGAAGPVIGSAISVVLCQVLPNVWYVRRDLRRRRALVA